MYVSAEEERSRFWWLWHNKLFETTPLTGYAFINGAKRLSEVIVWYGLIFMFTCFTANNVRNLINRYNSQPMRTEVVIASNAIDANITNFTLKLRLPIAEMWGSRIFWSEAEEPLLCDKTYTIHDFVGAPVDASRMLEPFYELIKSYNPQIASFKHELNESENYFKTPLLHLNQSTFSTEQVLKELENKHGHSLTAVWDKLGVHNESEVQINEAVDAFKTLYQPNTDEREMMALYLYGSIMSDESLYTPFLNRNRFNMSSFLQSQGQGLNAKDVIDRLNHRVMDIAPFQLPADLSATKIVFRQWESEYRDVSEFGDSFIVEYLFLLPDGVKEFSLDIFPPKQLIEALFVVMHFDKYMFNKGKSIFEAMARADVSAIETIYNSPWAANFLRHFQQLIACDTEPFDFWEQMFPWYDYVDMDPRETFLSFFDPFLDFYSSRSDLQLHTASGYITMEPFMSYQIKYLPIGRIISQTEVCTKMDLTECVELCQINYALTNCNCLPWNMQYLKEGDNNPICHLPCPGLQENRDQCSKECERNLAHPCDQFLYRSEIIKQRPTRKR